MAVVFSVKKAKLLNHLKGHGYCTWFCQKNMLLFKIRVVSLFMNGMYPKMIQMAAYNGQNDVTRTVWF